MLSIDRSKAFNYSNLLWIGDCAQNCHFVLDLPRHFYFVILCQRKQTDQTTWVALEFIFYSKGDDKKKW